MIEVIEGGTLMELLEETWLLEAAGQTGAVPMQRVPVDAVPEVAPFRRATW